MVKKALADLALPVSLSHDILPEFREFERTLATVCNAYVLPKMKSYLDNLSGCENIKALRIMQSNGGSISAPDCRYGTGPDHPFRSRGGSSGGL